MRTYTHGVIGYLLYAKRPRYEQRLAVVGGILPDVFLALGFVAHSLENLTHSAMAAELQALLHHSTLHTVTVSLHSFVVVGPFLVLSHVCYKPAMPFFVGMLAHGIADFLTHRQWAYNHVFPLPFAHTVCAWMLTACSRCQASLVTVSNETRPCSPHPMHTTGMRQTLGEVHSLEQTPTSAFFGLMCTR